VTGTIASPYATISIGGSQISLPGVAGGNQLTINSFSTSDIQLIINALTAGEAVLGFYTNGTPTGYIGSVGAAGQLVAGSATGDVVLRSNGGRILFTVDSGVTSAIIINSNRSVQVALASSGVGTFGIGAAPDSVFQVLAPGSLGGFRVAYNGTSNNYYDADSHNFRTGNAATATATLTAVTAKFNGAALFNNASGSGQGVQTGFGTPTGALVVANFPGATATLAQCSASIANIINVFKNMGIMAA
jgi:hypothetical protein